jgi:VIT1/CCC1 family predicted Fe2+/Mn2+ transporter
LFVEELSSVEGEIYQVRMEARQDPLNYPIKLNNQIAALRGIVESADARPTDRAVEAFLELSGLLEVELRRLAETVEARLPELNGMLRQLGVEEIPAPELPGPGGE